MIARAAVLPGLLAIGLASCGNSPPPEVGSASGTGTTSATAAASCAQLGGISGQLDDHGAQTASGTSLTISAGDSFFSPTCLTRVAAGTVTLTVTNKGSALHNISVTSQSIDTDVPAGQTVAVQVAVAAGAPLTFFCKYHRTSGMQGALVPGG